MAKENKNNKPAETPAATGVDNIREQLDSASVSRKELTDAVLAKIKEEADENIKSQIKQRCNKANFTEEKELLNLRRERDVANITKKKLVHVSRLKDHLMGFVVTEELLKRRAGTPDEIFEREKINEKDKTVTVKLGGEDKTFKLGEAVPPVIDYVDYDSDLDKIKDWARKELQKAEDEHNKYTTKLKAKYGEYWRPSWY